MDPNWFFFGSIRSGSVRSSYLDNLPEVDKRQQTKTNKQTDVRTTERTDRQRYCDCDSDLNLPYLDSNPFSKIIRLIFQVYNLGTNSSLLSALSTFRQYLIVSLRYLEGS